MTSHCAKGQWRGGLMGIPVVTKLGKDDRNQHSILGGGNSNILFFSHLLGEDSNFDSYFFKRVGSTTNQNS